LETELRLLASIMFTDIVGYTSLMQQDEKQAIIIREKHRRVLEEKIQLFNGRILQYYGDGTLSMFGSAVESVKCAIDIQSEFNSEPKIPVRIGLHLGDVVYQDDGIYGDGVNVASRIQTMSIPGAILISEKIYDETINHPELIAKSLGSFELKNVKKSQKIYTIINPNLVEVKKEDLSHLKKQSKKSIAVLPFVNMSIDKENEYFSDGISEEILNRLAKIKGLQVTARTSSFAFKGKNIDVREIGKQLNVDTVIEGSVRRAGSKVRITAQLIKVNDGYHIWSENYDRDLEDIFAVQDEISLKIAHSLREKLNVQRESKSDDTSHNTDAYNFYLKAKYHFHRWIPSEVKLALKYFQMAIDLDPTSAIYYAAAGGPYIYLGATGYINSKEAYPKAKEYVLKALELDDSIPEPHYSLAMVHMFYDWEWDKAESRFQKALEINPNSLEAHQYYSMFLSIIRKDPLAINQAQQAVNLDPLSASAHLSLGDVYKNLAQYDEAIKCFERALELDPHSRGSLNSMAWAYFEKGDHNKAVEIFEGIHKSLGSSDRGITTLAYVYAKLGRTEEAMELLNDLHKRQLVETDTNLDGDFAIVYAGLGDCDKVFEYLERSFNERQGHLLFLRTPHWKDLEDDPRFKDIIKRMGL
jgi:adenylate cyclase